MAIVLDTNVQRSLLKVFFDRSQKLSQRAQDICKEITKNEINAETTPNIYSTLLAYRDGKLDDPAMIFDDPDFAAVLDEFCPAEYKQDFLCAVTLLNKYQYSRGWDRRSVRSKSYIPCWAVIFGMLGTLQRLDCYGMSLFDLAVWNTADSSIRNALDHDYALKRSPLVENLIAARLDRGDRELEDRIYELFMSETSPFTVTHTIIRAAIKSTSARLHEGLCALLIAARLQEGLRQAICESADCGSISGFMSICDTVAEHNLVRFSAVRRAIGTWTGIMVDDERICKRQLELMGVYLRDEKARCRALDSEDNLELNMALWAMGFYEIGDAMQAMNKIIDSGDRRRMCAMSYYINHIGYRKWADAIARRMILACGDDLRLVACIEDSYLKGLGNIFGQLGQLSFIPQQREKKGKNEVDRVRLKILHETFIDEHEARTHYARIKEIIMLTPKKKLEWKQCIFPWHSCFLVRSGMVYLLCAIAWLLDDNGLKDECCGFIEDADSDTRHRCLELVCRFPSSDIQRDTITAALGNRATYMRKSAYELIRDTELRPCDYRTLEKLMKYKYTDTRANICELLLRQDDSELAESIGRLLSAADEEVRTGGLDMLLTLSRDESRKSCFDGIKESISLIKAPTEREKILIGQITGEDDRSGEILDKDGYGLYDPSIPFTMVNASIDEDICDFFASCSERCTDTIRKLDDLIEENKNREYKSIFGGTELLGNRFYRTSGTFSGKGCLDDYPFPELWRSFFEEQVKDERLLLLMDLSVCFYTGTAPAGYFSIYKNTAPHESVREVFRDIDILSLFPQVKNHNTVTSVIKIMSERLVSDEIRYAAGKAFVGTLLRVQPEKLYHDCKSSKDNSLSKTAFVTQRAFRYFLNNVRVRWDDRQAKESLTLLLALRQHLASAQLGMEDPLCESSPVLEVSEYLLAYSTGIITLNDFYAALFTRVDTGNSIKALSSLVSAGEKTPQWYSNEIGTPDYAQSKMEPSSAYRKAASDIYNRLIGVILPVELGRGDTQTVFSPYIRFIHSVSGAQTFVRILAALGKDTLDRSDWVWSNDFSKRHSLSHLLKVCSPAEDDTPDVLSALLKKHRISERRIVEAAMYSPDWIPLIERVLERNGFTSGCYYFIAHMRIGLKDERRNAIVARYTPLNPEELYWGAFDINWFKECSEALGEKYISQLYDASKYIADGAWHSRARKYTDAALGRMNIDDTEKEIVAKRNKDLLMAYALIPLSDTADTLRRYRFIQTFLKQSKAFGAQRRQSEGKACEMALRNLATNSGYSDTMRLTLAMETELTGEMAAYFEWHDISDIRARIVVDETGRSSIQYEKNGKPLKNAPAALKKDHYLNELKETHKALTEQYSRSRGMFEQAMEDSTTYTAAEIKGMLANPVAGPILAALVYICGDDVGLIADGVPENKLPVRIAHPFDLYKSGKWREMQSLLFERQIKQPFKQVFRELYIKTEDERDQFHSLRYAGNQIQPKRTVGALRSRRWVADYEEGLQKIFYEENLVARIYALADWFSPADIEAPTLEWVEFSHRKTGKPVKIDDIPDIIFSEVMRDVDLAVSVAHAGGVDPEVSHSTIELRKAVVEFNLPLFGLNNVTLTDHHAIIKGQRAEYSIHLGSGIIHQSGGAQIAVLPVHSQHRGRLFLPFVDDDPKTAEVMSKIVLFAEDKKIKDPSILSQIK